MKNKSCHAVKIFSFLLLMICSTGAAEAQSEIRVATKNRTRRVDLKTWFLLNVNKDSLPAIDAVQLKLSPGKDQPNLVIAVIDGGIDITHKALQPFIRINADEEPANHVDDDHNGYIDDVRGWNFLGGVNGSLTVAQLEMTRMVKRYDSVFRNKSIDDVSGSLRQKFRNYQNLREQLENKILTLNEAYAALDTVTDSKTPVAENRQQITKMLRYHYNVDIDPRSLVGDNVDDVDDSVYGNNDVTESAEHGTHVTGIITKLLTDITGPASNKYFSVLPVRAIPDGDEYDKDVALAIRYAVDRGAKVINMSFGKTASPHREWVSNALKYAQEKDVLLVHAAGNNAANLDEQIQYPSDALDGAEEMVSNFIDVGALSHNLTDSIVAPFSNYGKINVDIFAPGTDIYSTLPADKYGYESGTSMAAPIVTAVAALIRQQYPKLKAAQVKEIILRSATKVVGKVLVPGLGDYKVEFSELCRTGAILNASKALALAKQIAEQK